MGSIWVTYPMLFFLYTYKYPLYIIYVKVKVNIE